MARHHNINGNIVPFTAEEEAEWDANEIAFAKQKAKEVKTNGKLLLTYEEAVKLKEKMEKTIWHCCRPLSGIEKNI